MSGEVDEHVKAEYLASLKLREKYAKIHLGATALMSGGMAFAAGYWHGIQSCKSLAEKLKDFLF